MILSNPHSRAWAMPLLGVAAGAALLALYATSVLPSVMAAAPGIRLTGIAGVLAAISGFR